MDLTKTSLYVTIICKTQMTIGKWFDRTRGTHPLIEKSINHIIACVTVSRQVTFGDIAQLGEHLLCKQGVKGSSPFISINSRDTRSVFDILKESYAGSYRRNWRLEV